MSYPPFFIDGKINTVLINDQGKGNVAVLATDLKNTKLNINQLRKFYDSFLRIYNSNISNDEKKVQLLLMKAGVEYAANKLNINDFANFIKDRINTVIREEDDFQKYMDAFKMHFEALVAYFKR